jgi:hypothetical protein
MLYLGKNGVVHRGIRSSRVLVSGNGRVQLADFRLSGSPPFDFRSSFLTLGLLTGTILDRLLRAGNGLRSLPHNFNHHTFYLRQRFRRIC